MFDIFNIVAQRIVPEMKVALPLLKSLVVFQDEEIKIGAISMEGLKLSKVYALLIEGCGPTKTSNSKIPFKSFCFELISFLGYKREGSPFGSYSIADPFDNADFTFVIKNNSGTISVLCEDSFSNEITDFTDSLGVERIRYVKKGGAIQEYDIEKITAENNEYVCGIVTGKGFRRFLKDNIISREKI